MVPHVTDQLERVCFAWPEPLVIDFLKDQYAERAANAPQADLARLHARTLRDAVQDCRHSKDANREALVSLASRNGVSASELRVIDRQVLRELVAIAGQRFRNSPRIKAVITAHLAAAIDPPVEAPSEKRVILFRREAATA